ncbi:MAG: NAD(+) synthase [Longimicrobiales bacterium]|nr:NAD(+) synthase [Longimicrobiales bacterium]
MTVPVDRSAALERALHEAFALDLAAEERRIAQRMVEFLRALKRRGLVVAISGGIDSSVSAALAVRAVGSGRVFGLLMPETDSSTGSLERGRALAEHLGMEYAVENIAPTLEAIGCYRWRDEAIRTLFPDYGPGWRNKIAISGGLEGRVNHFNLVVETPEGERREARLPLPQYLQIVAATNFKQRIRKTLEYFHADRLNYAVVGTPNRAEYDQGFFVKNGDGSADMKPIAHLYKVQVYAMARHLGLPDEICTAKPTTDTYSLPQSQDEFYYALPHREMDLALHFRSQGRPAEALASVLGVEVSVAENVYRDIDNKRRTTESLHWPPLLVEPSGRPSGPPA